MRVQLFGNSLEVASSFKKSSKFIDLVKKSFENKFKKNFSFSINKSANEVDETDFVKFISAKTNADSLRYDVNCC